MEQKRCLSLNFNLGWVEFLHIGGFLLIFCRDSSYKSGKPGSWERTSYPAQLCDFQGPVASRNFYWVTFFKIQASGEMEGLGGGSERGVRRRERRGGKIRVRVRGGTSK